MDYEIHRGVMVTDSLPSTISEVRMRSGICLQQEHHTHVSTLPKCFGNVLGPPPLLPSELLWSFSSLSTVVTGSDFFCLFPQYVCGKTCLNVPKGRAAERRCWERDAGSKD